jgi:CSLREA domain-containing protein
MTNQSSKERPTWSMTTKAMAAGLLVAVMAAYLILVDQTAQASTTFIVNIPGDTHDADLGDGLCDVNLFGSGQQCTLRAAIEQANATPGADVINFNIPDTFGTGVKTINVGALDDSGLPPITDQVTINGYSQPGASPNTLARGTNANRCS